MKKIIQIGCNNGSDDVYSYVTENKEKIEKVLLIDANPIAMEQAKEKYKEFSFCKFMNLAILPIDIGNNKIKLFCPLDNDISGFSSINSDHVKAHAHSDDLKFFEVETKSLSNLLKEFDGCDELFIDTEGLDALNLLSVNFSEFDIRKIIFEYIHTDGIVKYNNRLNSLIYYLQSFGYAIFQDENCIYNLVAEKP